jgi:hypothetical protein
MFLVVLYGCETWCLTLREERRLRVFENRLLRRMFGPKRDGTIGGWTKLNNEEFHKSSISVNTARITERKRTRRVGRGIFMTDKGNVQNFGRRKRKIDHKEDLDADGKIVLKLILKKLNVRFWTEFFCLRIQTSGALL